MQKSCALQEGFIFGVAILREKSIILFAEYTLVSDVDSHRIVREFDLEVNWRNSPTVIEYFVEEIDYMLFIDETGVPTLKNYTINNTWFSMTGIMIKRTHGPEIIKNIMRIKHEHWLNAMFKGERVVFHSRELRKRVGQFNPKVVDYEKLKRDIETLLKESQFKIFASAINKDYIVRQYAQPYPVYWLSLLFIIERFSIFLNNNRARGVIILESRGKREDSDLLRDVVPILDRGTRYVSADTFSSIKGVYFNKKRTPDCTRSYPYLEIADIIGYEVYNSITKLRKSALYEEIKNKFYNYPNVEGYGLKIFNNEDN
ncbi:DUF3800 domain-containing protein [Abiotrophia defectiva]|nr:DUF3800 domain-containing protein [Abiotrophia defectiva]